MRHDQGASVPGTLLFSGLVLVALLAAGCTDDAGFGSLVVTCAADRPCAAGWECVYSTDHGDSICVREGAQQDIVNDSDVDDTDSAPDTALDTTSQDESGDLLDAADVASPHECTHDDDCAPAAPCRVAVCKLEGAVRVCREELAQDGDACDDDDPCTAIDECSAGECVGREHPCADLPSCMTCESCVPTLAAGYCYIDGACVAEGSPNPDNSACQACVSTGDDAYLYGWSGCPDGVTCSDITHCQCTATTDMTTVPAGTYAVGCDDSHDDACNPNELPRHDVALETFDIDTYEVTVEDFACCVTAGACSVPGSGASCNWGVSGKEQRPANCVTWQQAADYCAWLGKRLPSEAEWEVAAQGSTYALYPWGDAAADCNHAVMDFGSGPGCGTSATWDVGSKPAGAGPWGSHDLAGNVAEWVADWYAADSYTSNPSGGPPTGSARVVRGGSYGSGAAGLRASARSSQAPTDEGFHVGFRCAR